MTTKIVSVSATQSKMQVNDLDSFTFDSAGNLGVASLNGGQLAGFRNRIINGDMRIDQRNGGSAFTLATSGTYGGPDRFAATWDGTLGSGTVQQFGFPNGTGMFDSNKFYYRWAQTSGGSGNTVKVLQQRIESVETLHNNTATFSFWAKADSAISVTPDLVQVFGSGGSPSAAVTITGATQSVTTTWARFAVTFSVPSIVGKSKGSSGTDALWVRLLLPPNATFGLETTGWQLELGSVATPFEQRPYGMELALCQRYYQIVQGTFSGLANSSTAAEISVPLLATLRAAPTLSNLGNGSFVDGSGAAGITNAVLSSGYSSGPQRVTITSSGMTQSRPILAVTQTLGFSAEL